VFSRLIGSGMLAAALALAAPAAASAFGPGDLTAAPSALQAGANNDFTIRFTVTEPERDLRSLDVHLPPGELATIAGTPQCSAADFTAKSCQAATRVGSVRATREDDEGSVRTVDGTLYNLARKGTEPARFGLRLTPPSGAETLLQVPIAIRPSDAGLDASIDNLPHTTTTDITEFALTLFGVAASRGFMSNPRSCAPATTTVDTTAYDGSAGSAAATFTPTGCQFLAFAPQLVSNAAGTARGVHPQLMTIIQQGAGQATASSLALTLPLGLSAVQIASRRACPSSRLSAGTCPIRSQVGSAQALTPVLPRSLQGPIVITSSSISALPVLAIDLHGAFDVRMQAAVGFGAPGRMLTTITGLPDVPLSRLTLVLNAGGGSLLSNARDLCDPPAPTLDAAFAAHSGASVAASIAVATPGCATVRPKATAQLTGIRPHRQPALVVRIRANTGPRFTGVGVGLPKVLRVVRKRARRGVAVIAGGRRVARPSVLTGTRQVAVGGLPNGGSRSVQLRLRRGALKAKRALRAGRRVRLAVTTIDATGRRRNLSLRVRAAR
jgi:hypothetical protein